MASYSGLWNNEYGENYASLSLINPTQRMGNDHKALAVAFGQRIYSRGAVGRILRVLVNGSVGDAVLLTHKRVQARSDVDMNIQGGAVPIETFNDINRATVDADRQQIANAIQYTPQPVYPKDKAGTGGGGKLGW